MVKLAIFASGSGTNAEQIIRHLQNNKKMKISLILSDKADAFVLQRAKNHNIKSIVFTKQELNDSDIVTNQLKKNEIDFIVLAGFMIKVPDKILAMYPDKIVNIHPALLPKHGGKGMYGMKVHQAVIDSKENKSGISIHYVNDKYDEGQIIFQTECSVNENDTPETLAEKIHKLEHEYYPRIIEEVVTKQLITNN